MKTLEQKIAELSFEEQFKIQQRYQELLKEKLLKAYKKKASIKLLFN